MATDVPSTSPLVALIRKQKTSSLPSPTTEDTYKQHDLLHTSFPSQTYTEHEKEEVNNWLSTAPHLASPNEDSAKIAERLAHLNRHLSTRTTILGSKPSIADLALYARLAPVVAKWSDEERTGEQGYHHIVRHLLFVQSSPLLGLELPDSDRLNISEDSVVSPIKPIDPKAEKERKKREKEAAIAAGETVEKESTGGGRKGRKEKTRGTGEAVAAAFGSSVPLAQSSDGQPREVTSPTGATAVDPPAGGTPNGRAPAEAAAAGGEVDGQQKKQKKEKAPKQKKQPEPAKETPLTPALIDLRVGHILKAERHPNADSLYVSTIAVGDPAGTDNTSEYEGKVVRTVCSGLNGLVPLEEMQNRKVVAVCNLKPVTMRGVKSCAMVLAASPRPKEGEDDNHGGPVELVEVPSSAEAGDRVNFEGWEGQPEGQLNPKKKIWEMCQIGFTTTESGDVGFEAGAVEKIKEEGRAGSGVSLLKIGGKGTCIVKTLKGATVR